MKDIYEGYTNSWQHLWDELLWLDLLLQLEVLKARKQRGADVFDKLKGLVISDEEINKILWNNEPVSSELQDEVKILKERIGRIESLIQRKVAKSLEQGTYLSLPQLAHVFNLNFFEERCIVICLAVELDSKYAKIYGYLQDDVTQKKPTVDFVIKLLWDNFEDKIVSRLSFFPESPLMQYILLNPESLPDRSTPLIAKPLKIDNRIVNFLLGFDQLDVRINAAAEIIPPGVEKTTSFLHEKEAKIQGFIKKYSDDIKIGRRKVLFYFYGPPGAGKEHLVKTVCNNLDYPILSVDMLKLINIADSFKDAIWAVGREVVLVKAVLCIENFECLIEDESKYQFRLKLFVEMLKTLSPLTFVLGRNPWIPGEMAEGLLFIKEEFNVPDEKDRKHVWNYFSKGLNLGHDVDLDVVVNKFRFTPGQIKNAILTAEGMSGYNALDEDTIQLNEIYRACHLQSSSKLKDITQRVEIKYNWKDIILPQNQLEQLDEICNHVKYRHIVYGSWRFEQKLSYGKGLNVLFYGPPGTGKTMAAQIIAGELQLELYKIDLSQVVSKYIGETEKRLQRVFEEAKTSNAILFFDEADALFGKRSEVKDAHDRYSNIEIAYLLQKMEEHDGISILATNLRKNLDEAFTRRLSYSVEFPFPDEEHRRRLWELAFPEQTPRDDDIDFVFLSKKFDITGGNIKNIVLSAAFLAAGDCCPVSMKHIIHATRRELQKTGKNCVKSDFGEYAYLLGR